MKITLTLEDGQQAEKNLTVAEVAMMEEAAREVRELTGCKTHGLAQALLFNALRRGMDVIKEESMRRSINEPQTE